MCRWHANTPNQSTGLVSWCGCWPGLTHFSEVNAIIEGEALLHQNDCNLLLAWRLYCANTSELMEPSNSIKIVRCIAVVVATAVPPISQR